MEVNELIGYVDFLIEEEYEQKLFQRWCNGIQFEISFEDFKESLKPKKVKTEAEIMNEVFDVFKNVKGV